MTNLSNKQLKELLSETLDRLELAATTGEINCEETRDFCDGVQALLEVPEDDATPEDKDEEKDSDGDKDED